MLLPQVHQLWIFVAAAIGLAMLPGPAVFYIVARSMAQGRIAGLVSVLGIGTGGLIHVVAAAFGVSAILMASSTAFATLKFAGAAYLIYLGLQALRTTKTQAKVTTPTRKRLTRVFTDGVLVNVFNPKTALFFLAFLPQFVTPGQGAISIQMVSLGLLFVGIALISDSIYVLASDAVTRCLKGHRSGGNLPRYAAAMIYIALGISTLFISNSTESPS